MSCEIGSCTKQDVLQDILSGKIRIQSLKVGLKKRGDEMMQLCCMCVFWLLKQLQVTLDLQNETCKMWLSSPSKTAGLEYLCTKTVSPHANRCAFSSTCKTTSNEKYRLGGEEVTKRRLPLTSSLKKKTLESLILHDRFNVAQKAWDVWLEAKWTKRLQSLAWGLQSQSP